MTDNLWDEWAEEMCKLTDDLAKEVFCPNSPDYELQQSLIQGAKRYREAKKCANGST